jgi:hypothetical protein
LKKLSAISYQGTTSASHGVLDSGRITAEAAPLQRLHHREADRCAYLIADG